MTLLQTIAQKATVPRAAPRFPQLRAVLSALQGYVTSGISGPFVATAIEVVRASELVSTYKLVLAFNSTISRVEIVGRGVAMDPPEYIDVASAGGVLFSLQRISGTYYINGTGKLSAASFNTTLAQGMMGAVA
jgi:hypothetical protein